ncbi:hypothetical protein [Hirschia litorea]|uniref:Uncharacterized protein n=1 Tax=Hirschia litorea TaxID=1199156 RepID=A0ABW2IH38_9PROT
MKSDNKQKMKQLALWLYGRMGQMACFFAGGMLLIGEEAKYNQRWPTIVIGIVILVCGLVLRQQMIYRETSQSLKSDI